MQRWIRLSWVGLTNCLLLLPVVDSLRSAILYGSSTRIALLVVVLWWGLHRRSSAGFCSGGDAGQVCPACEYRDLDLVGNKIYRALLFVVEAIWREIMDCSICGTVGFDDRSC